VREQIKSVYCHLLHRSLRIQTQNVSYFSVDQSVVLKLHDEDAGCQCNRGRPGAVHPTSDIRSREDCPVDASQGSSDSTPRSPHKLHPSAVFRRCHFRECINIMPLRQLCEESSSWAPVRKGRLEQVQTHEGREQEPVMAAPISESE